MGVKQALGLRDYLIGDWPAGLRLTRTSAGIGSMFSKTRGAFTMRFHPAAAHSRFPSMLHVHRVHFATIECSSKGLTKTVSCCNAGLGSLGSSQ